MLPRGRVYRYPPGHNMPEVAPSNVPGGILFIPYDMGGMPVRDAGIGQPMPVSALASLANATPEQQRTVSPFCSFSVGYCFIGIYLA